MSRQIRQGPGRTVPATTGQSFSLHLHPCFPAQQLSLWAFTARQRGEITGISPSPDFFDYLLVLFE